MKKRELVIIGILAILLAFMDITGLPSSLFINIEVLDVTPFYWTLMFNFIIIGIIAFLILRYLCPNWKLGLNKSEIAVGLKKYGIVGIIVGIISCIALPYCFTTIQGYSNISLYIILPTYVILGIYSLYIMKSER